MTLSLEHELMLAANAGDEAEVRRLLLAGADANVGLPSGDDGSPVTALIGALVNKAGGSIVQALIDAKGNVAGWPPGETEFAVLYALAESKPQLIEQLIRLGLDADAALPSSGNRPLHVSISQNEAECGRVLIRAGASPDQEMQGYPPIQLAMALDSDSWGTWAEMLLNAGADLEATNDDGPTSLMQALNQGRPDAALWLLEHGADPFAAVGKGGLTPLHGASSTNAVGVVRWILGRLSATADPNPDIPTVQGYSPLHLAAQEGHKEAAQALMEYGANPVLTLRDLLPSAYPEPDAGALSPVFSAAGTGHVELALNMLSSFFGLGTRGRAADVLLNRMVSRTGDETAIRFLISQGADPSRIDPDYGWAPIHWAACFGNAASITTLVASGVKVDQRTRDDLTALVIADGFQRDDASRALVALGADANLAAKLGAVYGRRVRESHGESSPDGLPVGVALAAGALAGMAVGAAATSSPRARERTETLAAAALGAAAGVAVKNLMDRRQVGQPIGLIDGDSIRSGQNSWDPVAYHLDGNQVRRGDNSWGDVVATIDGERIRLGDASWGEVIATVSGCQVRAGDQSWGDVVATLNGQQVLVGDPGWVGATAEGDMTRAGALAAALVLL